MAEIFDPNAAGQDFDAETASVARQQKLADFLRKQYSALQGQVPSQGQMVGGQWIAPSAGQAVVAAAGGYEANKADQLAAQQEQTMLGRQAQQAAQWRASLPQAIQAQAQQTAPFMAPGIDGEENIPGTETITQQARAAVPVDASTRLKHTLEGMRNPMTAKEAVTWNTGMAEETKREDTQQAARENLAATLQQRMFEVKVRSQDANNTLAQKAEYQKQLLELQNQWHLLASGDKRYMADALAGRGAADKTARAEERKADKIRNQVEHIGTRMKDVSPMLVAGQAVQDMFDKYGDKVPTGLGMAGRKVPTGMQPDDWVKNNQAVKALTNALIRNQAGLSQTLSESERAELELIVNGTATGAQFKKSWDAIRAKVNAYPMTIGASFEPEAVQLFNERGGNLAPIMSKAERAAKQKAAATTSVPVGGTKPVAAPAMPGASNPDGSSVNPRDDQIRIIQAERAKATDPQDIIALDRELERLGAKPKSALPASKAAAKPNAGWKIEAVP